MEEGRWREALGRAAWDGLPWEQQLVRSPAFKAEACECCRFLGAADGVCVSGVGEHFCCESPGTPASGFQIKTLT